MNIHQKMKGVGIYIYIYIHLFIERKCWSIYIFIERKVTCSLLLAALNFFFFQQMQLNQPKTFKPNYYIPSKFIHIQYHHSRGRLLNAFELTPWPISISGSSIAKFPSNCLLPVPPCSAVVAHLLSASVSSVRGIMLIPVVKSQKFLAPNPTPHRVQFRCQFM